MMNQGEYSSVAFDELPLEFWLELAGFLSLGDLLQLRCCNQRMKSNLSQEIIWKRISRQRWLNQLSQEEEIRNILGPLRRKYDDVSDWSYFCRKYHHSDNHIIHRIEKLSRIQSTSMYWSRFDIVLKNKTEYLLPLLTRITVDEEVEGIDTPLPYDVITTAQHLLDSIRHKTVFQTLWNTTPDVDVLASNVERIYLNLAMMDPSYDRISHHILDVRKMVNMLLLAKYHNDLNTLYEIRPALRIEMVIQELFKILKVGRVPKIIPNREIYNEDLMITRIYAGEVIGHPFLILAIIQSICKIYKIDTIMTRYYLIIKDPGFEYGETYMTLGIIDTEVKYFTRRSLIRTLMHETGLNRNDVDKILLPVLLGPVHGYDCRTIFFDELYVQTKGSISDKYMNRSESVPIEERYRTQSRLYPESKQRFSTSLFADIADIASSIKALLIQGVDDNVDPNFQLMKRTPEYQEILQIVKERYPWDCHHVYSPGIITDRLTYLDWLKAYEKIVISPNTVIETTRIGTFALYKHSEFVCIVSSQFEKHSTEYTGYMDCLGEFYVVETKFIKPLEWDKNQVLEYLGAIHPTNRLGLLFERIDWNKKRLTLNARIKSCLQATPESPTGLLACDLPHITK